MKGDDVKEGRGTTVGGRVHYCGGKLCEGGQRTLWGDRAEDTNV